MPPTNDFVEASSWASTVEETLRTSGTAFNFSFSIVTRGRQFYRCGALSYSTSVFFSARGGNRD